MNKFIESASYSIILVNSANRSIVLHHQVDFLLLLNARARTRIFVLLLLHRSLARGFGGGHRILLWQTWFERLRSHVRRVPDRTNRLSRSHMCHLNCEERARSHLHLGIVDLLRDFVTYEQLIPPREVLPRRWHDTRSSQVSVEDRQFEVTW